MRNIYRTSYYTSRPWCSIMLNANGSKGVEGLGEMRTPADTGGVGKRVIFRRRPLWTTPSGGCTKLTANYVNTLVRVVQNQKVSDLRSTTLLLFYVCPLLLPPNLIEIGEYLEVTQGQGVFTISTMKSEICI